MKEDNVVKKPIKELKQLLFSEKFYVIEGLEDKSKGIKKDPVPSKISQLDLEFHPD